MVRRIPIRIRMRLRAFINCSPDGRSADLRHRYCSKDAARELCAEGAIDEEGVAQKPDGSFAAGLDGCGIEGLVGQRQAHHRGAHEVKDVWAVRGIHYLHPVDPAEFTRANALTDGLADLLEE